MTAQDSGKPLLEARNIARHFSLRQTGFGPFGRKGLLKAVDGVTLSVLPGRTLGLVGVRLWQVHHRPPVARPDGAQRR